MKLKLAPHCLPGGEEDTRTWCGLHPAIAKSVYGFDALKDAPGEVLKVGKPDDAFQERHDICAGDSIALARQYVAEIFAPLIQVFPWIDAWEGPNEIAIAPDETERMRHYVEFLAEFAKQIHVLGKRAVIGAWAVGNPELSLWQYYGPALQACRDYGAILSRHSYGPLNEWYAYRHRLDEKEFQKLGYYNTPLIISECGADGLGQPGWSRWKVMYRNDKGEPDIARYWNEYLLPFTKEIEKDPYVLGAALYTVGTGFAEAWKDFDVAGVGLIPYLAEYAEALPDENEDDHSQGETVMDDYTFLTTLFGEGTNTDDLRQFAFDMHDWLAKHGGSINGFRDAPAWWMLETLPDFCYSRKDLGQWVLIWGSPDASIAPTIRKVTYQMKVWGVSGDWVKVNDTPAMWVKGANTQATP